MIMQKTDYEVPEEDGMMIKFSFPYRLLIGFPERQGSLWTSVINDYPFHDRLHQAAGSPEVPLNEVTERRKAYKENPSPVDLPQYLRDGRIRGPA